LINDKKTGNVIMEMMAQQLGKIGKTEPLILILLSAFFGAMIFLQAFGISNDTIFYGGVILIAAMWIIWYIKFRIYGVYGNRIPVLRLYKNNLAKLTIENVNTEKGLGWGKNADKPPTPISRINKHVDMITGRPFLISAEGFADNICIWDLIKGSTGEMARDLNTKFEIVWNTAWQACQNELLKLGKKFITDPQFIAIVIVGLGLLILFGFIMGMNNQLTEMGETLKEILKILATK